MLEYYLSLLYSCNERKKESKKEGKKERKQTNKLWFIFGQISVPSVNGFIGMYCSYSKSYLQVCLDKIFALGLKEFKIQTEPIVVVLVVGAFSSKKVYLEQMPLMLFYF